METNSKVRCAEGPFAVLLRAVTDAGPTLVEEISTVAVPPIVVTVAVLEPL